MSNMGYARFRNTVKDLRDCYDHLLDDMSEEEEKARGELIEVCLDIIYAAEGEGLIDDGFQNEEL